MKGVMAVWKDTQGEWGRLKTLAKTQINWRLESARPTRYRVSENQASPMTPLTDARLDFEAATRSLEGEA